MGRYSYLGKDALKGAWGRLMDAFLAARDGYEVEEIVLAVLTHDERLRIGRRIQIAQMLAAGMHFSEIARELRVGRATVAKMAARLDRYEKGFELITKRSSLVESEYKRRGYKKVGGSLKVYKKTVRTGFSRKNVKRK